MVIITAEIFEEATGRPPVDDDLERCNCPNAGKLAHSCCGWNVEQNKPQYEVGPIDFVHNLRKAGL